MDFTSSYEDVAAYLQQVKLESDRIPNVVTAHTSDRSKGRYGADNEYTCTESEQYNRLKDIDEECQRLNLNLSSSIEELKYFRRLKDHISQFYGIQKAKSKSSLLLYGISKFNIHSLAKYIENVEIRRELWRSLLETEPPSIFILCETGIHLGSVQEFLNVTSEIISENSEDKPVPTILLKWLFILLLLLDDLHSLTECISCDLQRTRRTLLRRHFFITNQTSNKSHIELASLKLITSIIAEHFNQR